MHANHADSHRGEIQIIFGPMFSGKSTELLRRIRRYTIAQRKCLVLKYQNDTRYDVEKLSTHDLIMWSAQPCSLLSDVEKLVEEDHYDVIGVDEGQFFPDIASFCERWANQGRTVIVAALDGTFQRKGFGNILELVPMAEQITKLTAVCVNCHADASFTKRLGSETEIEVIGGADKYIAVCRTCFHEPVKRVHPVESPTKFLRISPFNSPLKDPAPKLQYDHDF